MKQPLLLFLGLTVLTSFLSSCEDDDAINTTTPGPAVIEFSIDESLIDESEIKKTFTITFNKPSPNDGQVKISFDQYRNLFSTDPPLSENGILSLNILKGTNKISFGLLPSNNSFAEGHKTVNMQLIQVPANFTLGTKKTHKLTILDDELGANKSIANFIQVGPTLSETNTEGHLVQIHISEAAAVTGAIKFSAISTKATYGKDYNTEPAFVDGQLEIPVTAGTSVTSFKVFPIDNETSNGELEIDFEITELVGNISKGARHKEIIKISDDELEGKPRGYQIAGGQWSLKRDIEYDEAGRISRAFIEQAFPNPVNRIETYHYNDAGQLVKINLAPTTDRLFTWENGRVTKEEYVQNGTVREIQLFDYDASGNIAGTQISHLQDDGSFLITLVQVHLYFQDGNLYKTLTYTPDQNGGEPIFVSTRTYDNYIEAENPFPMANILPMVKSQTKLHSTFVIEEGGKVLQYDLTYEFDENGRVGKRFAKNGSTNEEAIYLYY
jgi:hypothetical protein